MSSQTGKADRVLFLADCGPEVGGGHVMRCLSLARAMKAKGATCGFLSPSDVAVVLDVFAGSDFERLPAPGAPLGLLLESAAKAAAAWRADILVFDHYGLGAAQERKFRKAGRRLVAIDDLAQRTHDCDLVIDPSLGRSAQDYAGLAPDSAQVLAGPAYALLRPQYAARRAAALARRRSREPPRRLLVSLGLMDLHGVTGEVVRLIQPELGELKVDVAVGSGAPSLALLRQIASRDRRLRLHVDALDMAELIADADIGVGAGGSSTWERAALGLPSLSLVLAGNQQALALELERRGAVLAVEARGGELQTALRAAFLRLMQEPELRSQLSSRSAALCDGKGASRAAEAILGLIADGEA